MKLSIAIIFLSAAAVVFTPQVYAQESTDNCTTTDAAQETCYENNQCTKLEGLPDVDTNCGSAKTQHCNEIEACLQCETETRAAYVCQHGPTCGDSLVSEEYVLFCYQFMPKS
jgi:hypothetical protein